MKLSKLIFASICLLSLVACDMSAPKVVSQISDKDERLEIIENIKQARSLHRDRKDIKIDYYATNNKKNNNAMKYTIDDIVIDKRYVESKNANDLQVKKNKKEGTREPYKVNITENYHFFNIKEEDGSYGAYHADVVMENESKETYPSGYMYNSVKDKAQYDQELSKENAKIEEPYKAIEKMSDLSHYANLHFEKENDSNEKHYKSSIHFNKLDNGGVGVGLTVEFDVGYYEDGVKKVSFDNTYYDDYSLRQTRSSIDYEDSGYETYEILIYKDPHGSISIDDEYYRAFHDDYIHDEQAQLKILEEIDNAYEVPTNRSVGLTTKNTFESVGDNGSIKDYSYLYVQYGLRDNDGNMAVNCHQTTEFEYVNPVGEKESEKKDVQYYHTKLNKSKSYSIYKIDIESYGHYQSESFNSVTASSDYQNYREMLYEKCDEVWNVVEEVARISDLATLALDELKNNPNAGTASFEFYKQEEYNINIEVEFKNNPEFKSLKIENKYSSTYQLIRGEVTTVDLTGAKTTKYAYMSVEEAGKDYFAPLSGEYGRLFEDIE